MTATKPGTDRQCSTKLRRHHYIATFVPKVGGCNAVVPPTLATQIGAAIDAILPRLGDIW